jgi:pantoate--beta-alanine ligase
MQTIHDAAALRAAIRAWRAQGQSISFVPTMGNLHAGHLALVQLARARADRVVASIFVNPTQFGPGEDFARYPRTLERDQAGLASAGCDLLFAPTVEVLYPFGPANTVRVSVPEITTTLEGEHREGHFDGVATVVTKLFNLVQPDLAVFGQKDWQQMLLVRRLVRDLSLPLEIVAAPTVREADGLALSSRNQYLDAGQRARAAEIHATLQAMRAAHLGGQSRAQAEAEAEARLRKAGFEPDYAAIRRGVDLTTPADTEHGGLIALIAARLGATRLIDNLPFDGG